MKDILDSLSFSNCAGLALLLLAVRFLLGGPVRKDSEDVARWQAIGEWGKTAGTVVRVGVSMLGNAAAKRALAAAEESDKPKSSGVRWPWSRDAIEKVN